MIDESRCPMMIIVLRCASLRNASWMSDSDSESMFDVASSSMRMLGFFRRTRAIAIRCLWPTDRVTPRSPICVSYPFGMPSMKSWAFADCAANTTFSSDA